jgi:pyruvate dehydrogenase E2 component (dihydrolipoamide acetyltransferase)
MNELIKRVTMPKWGLSMSSGKITDWIAAEGDQIAEGDELADIDTDKIAATVGARWVRRATPEFVREHTGQPIGGVAPLG